MVRWSWILYNAYTYVCVRKHPTTRTIYICTFIIHTHTHTFKYTNTIYIHTYTHTQTLKGRVCPIINISRSINSFFSHYSRADRGLLDYWMIMHSRVLFSYILYKHTEDKNTSSNKRIIHI